jgi:hypothetical protein
MVYVLSEGDASKRESVLDMGYAEAIGWLSFKKYESWLIDGK